MAEMFAKLEASIKGEIATLHEGMNHLLKRVEVTEESLVTQGEGGAVPEQDELSSH